MSFPPPARSSSNPSALPLRVTPPPPASHNDLPPLIERSPRLPPSPALPLASSSPPSSAQRYLQNRDRKLFDSADYFSTSPTKRAGGSIAYGANTGEAPNAAPTSDYFDQVEYEANRLTAGQEPRASTLSFEMFTEIDGATDDDCISSSDEGGTMNNRKAKSASTQQHPMRRGSMEEFFVEENEHETVKHAILEKPKLKRWDSGDFYSSPNEYRKMLATQAKEVLRQALDHAEEDHRPMRRRRSSLSISENYGHQADS